MAPRRALATLGGLALLAAAAVGAPGCGGLIPASWFEDDARFVAAVPDTTRAAVRGAPVAARRDGEPARTPALMRPVVEELNGLTHETLRLLEFVVAAPPTTRDETTRVWGPADSGIHGIGYRLTVTDAAEDGGLAYDLALGELAVLLGESGDAALAGETVLAGDDRVDGDTHTGGFAVDAGALRRAGIELPAGVVDGAADVVYAVGDDVTEIAIDLDGIELDGAATPLDAQRYGYRADADGGALCLTAWLDVWGGGATESLAVAARWLPAGAGAAAGELAAGDVGAPVAFEECWDAAGETVYWWDAAAAFEPVGDPAACVIDPGALAAAAAPCAVD